MLISDKHSFIFVHNPKCAGTSVRKALQNYDTRNNYFWMFAELNGSKIDKAHMPLHVLKVYSPQVYELFKNYFTFMFVRHPIERCISGFNEIHKELARGLAAGKLSGDEYGGKLNAFISSLSHKKISGYYITYRHFIKQSDYCFLGGKRHIDQVLRIEDYPGNLEVLNIHHPFVASRLSDNMSMKNVSPAKVKLYVEYLNDESIAIIRDLYREDYLNFLYT
ncbi:MAG: sulfotransferase family protein [Nitrospira sp.]|nr:sulfotransferase family protein [Nitrospira sp.]